MITIKDLMTRLWKACECKPDLGGDLWSRGIAVISRKRGVLIYLNKFDSSNTSESEQPSCEVSITQTEVSK